MKKTGPKPIVVKVGNVQVKVYRSQRTKKGRTYDQFNLADYSTGKRRLITFANERDARQKATEIATKLANREGDVLNLRSADRITYLIERPETWPALGRVGRRHIEAHFDTNMLNDRLVQQYQRVLDGASYEG